MLYPSVKRLREAFPGKALRLRAIMEECGDQGEELEGTMDQLDTVLDGHGVELISGSGDTAANDSYFPDVQALYVNMGDTYNTTIVYDLVDERYLLTTMGDEVEHLQNQHGIEVW